LEVLKVSVTYVVLHRWRSCVKHEDPWQVCASHEFVGGGEAGGVKRVTRQRVF